MATPIQIQVRVDSGGAETAMRRVQKETDTLSRKVKSANGAMNQYGKTVSRDATRANRQWRSSLQQAGFQFGDFAVQVQNGTNKMQAFGQQGSQLAGVFGPIGALVGAGIAIFSALYTAISKSREAAAGASSDIKTLGDALDAMGKVAEVSSGDIDTYLTMAFRESADAVRDLVTALRDARFAEIMTSVEKHTKSAASSTDAYVSGFDNAVALMGEFSAKGDTAEQVQERYANKIGATRDQLIRMQAAFHNISGAENMNDLVKALAEARSAAADISGPIGEKMSKVIDNFAKANGVLETISNEAGKSRISVKSLVDMFGELDNISKVSASDLVSAFGDSSVAVQQLLSAGAQSKFAAVSTATSALAKQIEAVGIEAGASADQMVKIGAATKELTTASDMQSFIVALADARAEAEKIGGSVGDAVIAAIVEMANKADILKGILGDAADEAVRIADGLSDAVKIRLANSKLRSGVANGNLPPEALSDLQLTKEQIAAQRVLEGILARRRAANSSRGSGRSVGGGAATVDKLSQSYKQLLTALKPATTQSEKYAAAVDTINKAMAGGLIANQQEYTHMLDLANKKYGEAAQRIADMQDIADSMEQAFSDGFMSIINHTDTVAGAFKKMASSVVSELFRILVVQRLVGSFNAATGTGSGLAGVFGKALSFEGGGSTGFGIRSGGVDGKGGFMAVLHPNETVIDHKSANRNGSPSQNIVVNISTPNAESFRQSRAQVSSDIARAVAMGRRGI